MQLWKARPAKERANLLRRWYDLIMANQEDLAILMTTEQGKPLAEAKGEIAYAASFLEWAAEEGKRLTGDIVPASAADGDSASYRARYPSSSRKPGISAS